MVLTENGQQATPQGNFGSPDGNHTVVHTVLGRYRIFPRLNMLKGDGNMLVQFPAVISKGDPFVGALKQRTAQLLFQRLDRPCQVGLIAIHYLGGTGKALVFGNIVKNPIVIVTDIHNKLHIKMIYCI